MMKRRRRPLRVHAIQTGTVAIKARQLRGQGRGSLRRLHILRDRAWTAPLPIHAWAIEHPEGTIVIDTGETARATQPGYFPAWHPYFDQVRECVRPEDEIGPQLAALGIALPTVRWVILTHLHTDHAGGLHYFPQAEIVVARREYAAAVGFWGQVRGYLPQHWPAWFAPRLVDFLPTPVGPFPASLPLTSAGDVLLLPTPGHTDGHLSVLVRERGLTLLFAGDATYTEQLLLEQAVDGIASDEAAARQTLARLFKYVRETPTVYLPSHDPDASARLAARQIVLRPATTGPSSTAARRRLRLDF